MEGLEGKGEATIPFLEVMEMSTIECGDCCRTANVDSYTLNG